ncbi:hypothetical protein CHS0354_028639 [Potamilus streckersoni]|uniref:BAI1-associated protein 3 n=1 Tax=Potamilus streckersoni TaxID=2493646 RepID=A0AAE0W3M2_9BIVA|nr:hypothetical protein CHS0354_028639 [Potamilus streckersoni]
MLPAFRVQESDGNFFENFTALAWRQQNKRLRATSEDDKDGCKPLPSDTQYTSRTKLHQLSKKEFELLYIEVLYTIKHKIGTTIGGHLPVIQDLYQYAQEAFHILPEDHAHLLAKATKEKPPIVVLNVTVISAKGLEAKDPDGYSDPYCMLGIMPGQTWLSPEGESGCGSMGSSDDESPKQKEYKKKGLGKLSMKKKDRTVRDLLPAKYIQTTAVINKNLNPVWNEKFRFDLDDCKTDRLHLDIWDHDEEFSVFDAAKKLNQVQGFKGLGRFFKQIAQSARTSKSSGGSIDDFLGSVNVPLNDIPSTGVEKWFSLEGRSSRSNITGQINLRLSLSTREDRGIPEDDNWTDMRQHVDLMCIFIEHEIHKFNDRAYKWNGELPKAALTILHQHAIQGDLTEVQQAMCQWLAYSRKQQEHPLSYQLLLSFLQKFDMLWHPGAISRDEEEHLAGSLNLFIEYSLSLIRKQREVFPINSKLALSRLENMLRCLAQIYEMKIFRKICPFQKELQPEINSVVKKSALEWYERILNVYKTKMRVDQDEEVLQGLIELTNALNTDMHHAVMFYTKLYEELVKVPYFKNCYLQLEKLFGDELSVSLKETLSKLDKEGEGVQEEQSVIMTMGTTLFELYLAIQEFCKFKEYLPASMRKNLGICQYYSWFKFAVHKWLYIAKHKAFQRIHKAVELDKVVDVDKGVKYSTSAVDVCCCFSQITEFWKQLDWPDLVGAYPMVKKVTEDICNGAVLYADIIHEKLKQAGYYDDEGQFDVKEQLCVTINNIEQVRRSLLSLPESLQFNQVHLALDSNNASSPIKTSLSEITKEANKEMVSKIKQVVDHVANKMRPDIKKDVFHLNWAPEAVPADDAVGDLLEYLDSNFLTLNSNLLKTNFDRILESIWIEVIEEFTDVLDSEEPKQPIFYQRMYDALGLLVEFFNANDKGLTMQAILSPQFKELKARLNLHKLDTKSLIERFYEEKLEEQKNCTSTEFGILNIRTWYKSDTSTLLVEVLSAKDIIPLDANGLSDPYVVIQFYPEHCFTNVPTQQTKVVKKTLHPLFEESFEFNVSQKQCYQRGAALVFTVMDHDYVFQNDFAGEVYLSLQEVPGVDGQEVTGFEALNIMSLPLMQPKAKKFGALDVLSSRVGDKDAQEFVKKRSKVEEQVL